MKLCVELNGTDENPYLKLHLTQNPFPQIATHELAGACLHLQALGGEPIPDCAYIRRHLRGWNEEFIDLCCKMFKKGAYTTFYTTWPNG